MGCVPSFARVVCCLGATLAYGGLRMLWGKVVPVVVLLCTVLDSELCSVSAQCCGLRTWDFGPGYQGAGGDTGCISLTSVALQAEPSPEKPPLPLPCFTSSPPTNPQLPTFSPSRWISGRGMLQAQP